MQGTQIKKSEISASAWCLVISAEVILWRRCSNKERGEVSSGGQTAPSYAGLFHYHFPEGGGTLFRFMNDVMKPAASVASGHGFVTAPTQV